jgi:hypothetical protein
MGTRAKRRAVMGRWAQVDICPSESGFVLSVGPVSLWLDVAAAGDVVETLARALSFEAERTGVELAAAAPAEPPPRGDKRRKSN